MPQDSATSAAHKTQRRVATIHVATRRLARIQAHGAPSGEGIGTVGSRVGVHRRRVHLLLHDITQASARLGPNLIRTRPTTRLTLLALSCHHIDRARASLYTLCTCPTPLDLTHSPNRRRPRIHGPLIASPCLLVACVIASAAGQTRKFQWPISLSRPFAGKRRKPHAARRGQQGSRAPEAKTHKVRGQFLKRLCFHLLVTHVGRALVRARPPAGSYSAYYPAGKRPSTTPSPLTTTHCSKEDEDVLKSEYLKNPKPSKAARLEIVRKVALGEKEVQVRCTSLHVTSVRALMLTRSLRFGSKVSPLGLVVLLQLGLSARSASHFGSLRDPCLGLQHVLITHCLR